MLTLLLAFEGQVSSIAFVKPPVKAAASQAPLYHAKMFAKFTTTAFDGLLTDMNDAGTIVGSQSGRPVVIQPDGTITYPTFPVSLTELKYVQISQINNRGSYIYSLPHDSNPYLASASGKIVHLSPPQGGTFAAASLNDLDYVCGECNYNGQFGAYFSSDLSFNPLIIDVASRSRSPYYFCGSDRSSPAQPVVYDIRSKSYSHLNIGTAKYCYAFGITPSGLVFGEVGGATAYWKTPTSIAAYTDAAFPPYQLSANDAGEFVTSTGVGVTYSLAKYWSTNTGVIDLTSASDLPSGWQMSTALTINSSGNILGVAWDGGTTLASVLLTKREEVSSLVVSPNPLTDYSSKVTGTATVIGPMKSVTFSVPGIIDVPMSQGVDGTWKATFDAKLLQLVQSNTINVYANGIGSNGVKTSVSAKLTISTNIYTYPSSMFDLKSFNRAGSLVSVDGIACDNSVVTPAPELSYLAIPIPSAISDLATSNYSAKLSNLDGSGPVGSVSLGTVNGKACLVYYPPYEENSLPHPRTIAEVNVKPLRHVSLQVRWLRGGILPVQVASKSILLARPIVLLVHGINSDPTSWRTHKLTNDVGFFDMSQRVPLETVDHSSIQQGRGPLEWGAYCLSSSIDRARDQVLAGTFNPSFSDSTLTRGYSFTDYVGQRIAEKRVDVVAWSYGSLITRWYLSGKFGVFPYHWLDQALSPSWNVTYKGDIRKVVTLGGMWRGVPLCNYLNEINFSKGVGSMNSAPTEIPNPNGSNNMGGWVDGVLDFKSELNSKKPAIECMAINSPWELWLDFGDKMGLDGSAAHPFSSTVLYGAVAGDNESYEVGGVPFGNPYAVVDSAQSPTWFPFLAMEDQRGTGRGYSDGIVPVWSAAIPGSYYIVECDHSNLAKFLDAVQKAVIWLNDYGLPSGGDLNTLWSDPSRDRVANGDESKSWTFGASSMAPYPQSDLYALIGSEGRLASDAFSSHGASMRLDFAGAQKSGPLLFVYIAISCASSGAAEYGLQLKSAVIDGEFLSSSALNAPASLGTIHSGKTLVLQLVFPTAVGRRGSLAEVHMTLADLYNSSDFKPMPFMFVIP